MEALEISSKIIGIIVVSEILIQLIKQVSTTKELYQIKPYVVILVSLVLCLFENMYVLNIDDIIIKAIFEYTSISMMSYEIVVKRVFNNLLKDINKDEKPTSI